MKYVHDTGRKQRNLQSKPVRWYCCLKLLGHSKLPLPQCKQNDDLAILGTGGGFPGELQGQVTFSGIPQTCENKFDFNFWDRILKKREREAFSTWKTYAFELTGTPVVDGWHLPCVGAFRRLFVKNFRCTQLSWPLGCLGCLWKAGSDVLEKSCSWEGVVTHSTPPGRSRFIFTIWISGARGPRQQERVWRWVTTVTPEKGRENYSQVEWMEKVLLAALNLGGNSGWKI